MPDIVFAAGATAVRAVQLPLDAVQGYRHARAPGVIGAGPEMGQKSFDIAPVNVAADRLRVNLFQRLSVLVTHRLSPTRYRECDDRHQISTISTIWQSVDVREAGQDQGPV